MPDNIIPFPTRPVPTTKKASGLRARAKRVARDGVAGTTRTPSALSATYESTPVIFPHVPLDVRAVSSEQLGCHDLLLVPVHPSADADDTNFVRNIAREMLSEGGRPVFGWRIRTSALFVVTEFYAMHRTESGLVDVTPNSRGEHYVVFAPDYDIPADFDYLDRAVTRRFSTYVPPTRQARVAAEIALMTPSLLAVEQRLAVMSGLDLEDALSLKIGPDKLETALDLFIQCSKQLELLTMAVSDGREVIDFARFDDLQRRKTTLEALIEDEFERLQHRVTRKRPASRLAAEAQNLSPI
jgi:hypothetical protein